MSEVEGFQRDGFSWFWDIGTRWIDNDVYRHVNNVNYYSFFDTAIAAFLLKHGGLDIENSPVIGYVVETKCQYLKPITFPEVISVGVRAARLGRSSVTYEIGIFKEGEDGPAAFGHFVHVYVDRAEQKSAPIPEQARAAIEAQLLVAG